MLVPYAPNYWCHRPHKDWEGRCGMLYREGKYCQIWDAIGHNRQRWVEVCGEELHKGQQKEAVMLCRAWISKTGNQSSSTSNDVNLTLRGSVMDQIMDTDKFIGDGGLNSDRGMPPRTIHYWWGSMLCYRGRDYGGGRGRSCRSNMRASRCKGKSRWLKERIQVLFWIRESDSGRLVWCDLE